MVTGHPLEIRDQQLLFKQYQSSILTRYLQTLVEHGAQSVMLRGTEPIPILSENVLVCEKWT